MNKEIPIDVGNYSDTLEPGDRVRIPRLGGVYDHWAMYEGEGKVIHVTNVDKSDARNSSTSVITGRTRAKMKREDLHSVVGKDKAYKNNTRDSKRRPLNQDTILKRAKHAVGREMPYSALSRNCEHVTNWMRSDEFYSSQADNAEVGLASVLGGIIVFVIGFFIHRNRSSDQ